MAAIAASLAQAQQLDAEDALAPRRAAFALPRGVIYLDGNSLGALPAATPVRIAAATEREWGEDLILSWNRHDWIGAPRRIGDKIARLVGARNGEVIVADSTSVNLFKLVGAALALRPERHVILTEAGNFPTDLYVMQGLAGLLGGRVRVRAVPPAELEGAIDAETAVVVLTHVHYAAGARWPMEKITQATHAKGALMIWDLSHSAGALAVDLGAAGAEMAVGCSYKYLNGGPGAPSWLYVAERLQQDAASPLSGWMGHAAPFDFDEAYAPAAGVARFLCGTPPILSLAALEAGIDLFASVDMTHVEAKGAALCELFLARVRTLCPDLEFAGPKQASRRGLHLCFRHDDGYAVIQALIARGVIGDFRSPDLMRFGFSPLYVSFADAWRAAAVLADVLATRAFDDPIYHRRGAVT